ncbi:MAG: DNA polymerase III subunit epsilon [Pseudomonadota bacterium]
MGRLDVVFDTETTGVDPEEGHRVVEIGCVELDNLIPTGRTYHTYLNPERDMPIGAYQVHNLSAEFLSDKPLFATIADDFLAFIGDANLVAHNADFDFKFINTELDNIGRPPLPQNRKVDTWRLAKRLYPGQASSLDALCRRFEIDLSARTKHGALLDAELLAEVYLNLKGGRQNRLELMTGRAKTVDTADLVSRNRAVPVAARDYDITDEEEAVHAAFISGMNAPIWEKFQ